jgi:hypothetical protein
MIETVNAILLAYAAIALAPIVLGMAVWGFVAAYRLITGSD